MKTLIKILSIAILLSACIIEDQGSSKNFLINNSNHQIKIVPYLNGAAQSDVIKVANPNETLMVFQRHDRLKTLKPSYADLLMSYDSVKLVYDDLFAVWHLKTEALYPKQLAFGSSRNIMNIKNYDLVIDHETKHSIAGHFNFTFTEQDYLDASQ